VLTDDGFAKNVRVVENSKVAAAFSLSLYLVALTKPNAATPFIPH
jgi:hypothetical protein